MNTIKIINPHGKNNPIGHPDGSMVIKSFESSINFYNELSTYYRVKGYIKRNKDCHFRLPKIIDIREYSNEIVYEYCGNELRGGDDIEIAQQTIDKIYEMGIRISLVPAEVHILEPLRKYNDIVTICDFESWHCNPNFLELLDEWKNKELEKWSKK
tara:strand:+ start:2115 stop:2582 length:468 start_codon:yes stop_codon:yes gene_type:complete